MTNANAIASPLSRKATLVAVAVSQWTARKLDREITDEINRAKNASDDAGRFNKLLIEKHRMERLTSLVTKARKLHYTFTKPWCDEGFRILPNVLHEKFGSEFRKIQREFDEAADAFARDYPSFIEERKAKLNGMFCEDDYPSAADIRDKFKLETRVQQVPEVDDFRSDVLDADTVADIKRELAETSQAVIDDAMKHTVQQIVEVVGHMSEKLKTYKSEPDDRTKFTKTLVSNVRQLADLLPAFNFVNDAKLTAITERIQRELCVEEVEALREHEDVRASVQKSADDILRDVEGLLG